MPGTTDRGYPYPIDTDPIDVAGDIQLLAEAVDDDVAQYVLGQSMEAFVQSGSAVVVATAGNTYRVDFPRPFGGQPNVVAVNGDPESGIMIYTIQQRNSDHFTFIANRLDGSGVTNIVRANWIAHGFPPGAVLAATEEED